METTDSPPTLYALSLRQVVHRLNRLVHYVQPGHYSTIELLNTTDTLSLEEYHALMSNCSTPAGIEFYNNVPPRTVTDVYLCIDRYEEDSDPNRQRVLFHTHPLRKNEPEEEEEEEEEDEKGEMVVRENEEAAKNLCEDFSSRLSGSLTNNNNNNGSGSGLNPDFTSRKSLEALKESHDNACHFRNRMKKSYHSLLNTFVFGRGIGNIPASLLGNSSRKKPPISPTGTSSSHHSLSSSSASSSFTDLLLPPLSTEQDRLRASYRLAADLVEDIFNEYQRHYPLTDRALKLAIFGGAVNSLRRLEIKDAGQLTASGLAMLAGHPLQALSVAHLNSSSVSVNELIACLAPVTQAKHLTSLSVRHCNFSSKYAGSSKAACLVLSIGQLPRLTTLDVSFTDFNNHALEIVAQDLVHLRALNISSTKVTLLESLGVRGRGRLAGRLKVLLAHNTAASCHDEHLLEGLTALERLDISDSRSYLDTTQNPLNKLLVAFGAFPRLAELDLSGRLGFDYHEVEQLVTAKLSSSKSAEVTPLRFLGLLETSLNYDDLLDLMKASGEAITLTGNGNIHHILESLRRYRDIPVFVQKSLLHLYQTRFNLDSEEMVAARPAIIRLVIDLLAANLTSVNIVLVSTACLYIFTQMNVFAAGIGNHLVPTQPPLHPHILSAVVQVNMATMAKYCTNQPVIKNILLTLCSDRILQEITFDRLNCMQLVMDSLITFTEPTLNRLALAVCSILAAKIPTEQTTSIGQQKKYMGRLLEFVQRSNMAIDSDNREVLFKLALSALWNFTDESPKTCQAFIENRGLQLYIEALVLYHGQNSVETKILGLINNIAEVPYLRKDLIDGNLLHNLKILIQSEHIDISYFSAGILSQLASDRSLDWSQLKDFSLSAVLDMMKQVILGWQTPNFEMVAYRSFVPFIALLTCRPHPAVQLWALWAIHHVCTKSGSQKYCQMLYDERCLSLIVDILDGRIRETAGGSGTFESLEQLAFIRGRMVQNATPDCYASGTAGSPSDGVSPCDPKSTRAATEKQKDSDVPECSFCFSPCVTTPQAEYITTTVDVSDEALRLMFYRAQANQLSIFTCDCKLRHYIRRDPFIALPALILHTFAQECPRLVAKDFQF